MNTANDADVAAEEPDEPSEIQEEENKAIVKRSAAACADTIKRIPVNRWSSMNDGQMDELLIIL